MDSQTTPWSLILQFATDPVGVFNLIVARYSKPMYQCAKKWLSDSDAADAVQETFKIIWEKEILKNADPSQGKLRNLLAVYLKYVSLGISRDRNRRRERSLGRNDKVWNPEEGDELGVTLKKDIVQRVFAELWTQRGVKALYLQQMQGKTVKEVAAELEITEDNANDQLYNARRLFERRIRELIHEEYPDETDLLRYLEA